MSDKVKLIIEIPRNEYEYTCERTLSDRSIWDDAIRNGIPLDSVKAEIKEKCDRIDDIARANIYQYAPHREIQDLLCEILDNIGKTDMRGDK